jgi:hypothetical protein
MLIVTMAAAIGCYTINLRVAGERAAVESLRNNLVADARDIRNLQAELRTRARFPEMQRWNDNVFQMSAPAAGQFLRTPQQLASYGAAQAAEAAAPAAPAPAIVYAVTAPAPLASPSSIVVQAAYRPAAVSITASSPPQVARLIRAGYTMPARAAPLAVAASVPTAKAATTVRVAAAPAAKPVAAPGVVRLAMLDTPRNAVRAPAAAPRAAKRVAMPVSARSEKASEATGEPVDLMPEGAQ